MPDLYQFIDDIDADKQAMVVKRLEDRAQLPKFAEIPRDAESIRPPADSKSHFDLAQCGRAPLVKNKNGLVAQVSGLAEPLVPTGLRPCRSP